MDVEEKNIGARLAPALYPFADDIMAEIKWKTNQRIRKNNERFKKSRPFVVCKN